MAHTSLLGSVTIPGRPEAVSGVRAFTAGLLGRDCPSTSTAVLLVSELRTQSSTAGHGAAAGSSRSP